MRQLIGKLNGLWPEHSVANSIPKEIDPTKEKLEGAWETIGNCEKCVLSLSAQQLCVHEICFKKYLTISLKITDYTIFV